jgi:hypothetical protein
MNSIPLWPMIFMAACLLLCIGLLAIICILMQFRIWEHHEEIKKLKKSVEHIEYTKAYEEEWHD